MATVKRVPKPATTNNDPFNPVTSDNVDRDERFKLLLRNQLGDSGIPLLVNQAFLFVLAIIMMVAVLLGFINSRPPGNGVLVLEHAALVTPK